MTERRVIVDTNGRQFFADSFDRFGDDLNELIVSYMRLEDKIRLQCVAKQWKRLIFNRQTIIEITDEVYCDRLKYLLDLCPNIKSIHISTDVFMIHSSLDIITDHCPRLESITFGFMNVSDEEITRFYQRFGQTLKSIEFNYNWNDDRNQEEKLFDMCPNIVRMVSHQGNLLESLKKLHIWGIPEDQCRMFCKERFFWGMSLSMPNLTSLSLSDGDYLAYYSIPEPMTRLEQLSLYGLTQINERLVTNLVGKFPNLKRIVLNFNDCAVKHTFDDQILQSISRLRSLTVFEFNYRRDSFKIPITDSGVCQLIDNCKQLKEISSNFKLNITIKTIDKLTERALKSPKQKFSFKCFGSQSLEAINNLPKNLSIIVMDSTLDSDSSSD